MTAIIVDDEPKNIRILRTLLEEYCPDVEIVGEATSAESAIPVLNSQQPQLVFLDVEMPRGNAFDLLDKVKPINFEIIFITAFNEYSLRAFKYSALDYLLKPVNIEELTAAVERATKRIGHRVVNSQINNLFGNINEGQPRLHKIALPEKDGSLVFVELKEIMRFEAKRGYTLIFLSQSVFYISARPIKEFEEILPESIFFRVHNSHK
jgi:two-component system, LytTR family, response regulator